MHYHHLPRHLLTTPWREFKNPDSDIWEIRTRESYPEFPFGILVVSTDIRELAEHLVYLHNQRLPK